MFKGRLLRYLILLVIVAAMTIVLFWRELVDTAADGVSTLWSTSIEQEPMLDANFSQVKEIRFESEHNNIAQIKVDDLHVVARSESAVTLSVRIASRSSGDDFPGLRVAVLSHSGATLRRIEFRASEYAHSGDFSSNVIELPIQIKSGDARFAVSAFYQN
jgi:hypothetical protein